MPHTLITNVLYKLNNRCKLATFLIQNYQQIFFVEHAGVSCNCQERENFCQCKKSSSSSSESDSFMSCICCKKEKILKNLINRIPLCEPCQEVNQTNFYPHNYCDPLHSCICYNLVNRDILCQFKQTLTELERLDIYQQYCEILKNCKCCKKCGCKCKLPKKFKNGCAYFLKLEDACPNPHCEEEEINSDIFCCEEEEEEGERDNYLPEVTVKVPNCRGSCSRRKNEKKHEAKKFVSCPSIQVREEKRLKYNLSFKFFVASHCNIVKMMY